MVLFKTENLSFTYPSCTVKALDNVNIEINKGEFVLLMGKTGSGKSTLLKMLKKELTPHGTITGTVNSATDSIAFVPQNPQVSFVSENVRGELAFALENKKMSNDEIAVKIGETASFFNLSNNLDKKICEMSGGEQAIVAIASSMVADCDTLILDEPLSQLDPKSTMQVISLLRRVNEELGVTVILSSHMSDGIIDFCDRLVIMENGTVGHNSAPDYLSNKTDALNYFPIYTSLFSQRPLTVKSAIALSKKFKSKAKILKNNPKNIAVELKNVTFAYDKHGKDILSQLTFTAYMGKIHAVIGSNGSGKTTLLKVIAGIKRAYSGRVKVNGKVAYLPQNPQYLFTKDLVSDEIDETTAVQFQLKECANHHPYDLSGGQMQMLALAILSKQNYDILLLDEPSKALDVFSKRSLAEYLKSLSAQGKTIIIVSHDIDFVGDVSDYVSFLSDSIITINGDRRTVLSSLNYYTTQIRRITRSYLEDAVSREDLE